MPHVIVKLRPGKDWLEKVYKSDVQEKWSNVYKKPGYGPSDL